LLTHVGGDFPLHEESTDPTLTKSVITLLPYPCFAASSLAEVGEKFGPQDTGRTGRYQLRGEFYTPGLVPVATLPELQIEWAEVFEGV
jgi:hypothetical protein